MPLRRVLRAYDRLLLAIVVVAVAAGSAVIITSHNNNRKTYVVRTACSILTPAIARSIGGNDVVQQALKSTKTADTVTSFCVYRGADHSVSLVLRSPKNSHGAALNKQAFSSPPLASQKVMGYGDEAYWTPAFAQFNVLKNNQWFILTNGPNTPANRTLAQAKAFAAKISPRL